MLAIAVVWIDAIAREAILFAAIGFLIGGIDDAIVDAAFWIRALRDQLRGRRRPICRDFPIDRCTGRMAVFVPAWDEAAVIGAMLRATLARFDHPDWQLYAGAYPNDRATINAIAVVAAQDSRVRLVLNDHPGPTTKADCLNTLWMAAVRDSVTEGRAFKGVVLHDAEDVVHPCELRLYDRLLDRFDAVQIPVLPLADPASRWISGHYIDEFAEAHGRHLPVRGSLGAGLPLAGVGCAISVTMLMRIAGARGGLPFDETSLTEDDELGLTVRALGGRGVFVDAKDKTSGAPVAVRAYFPATLDAAVRQKARWMTGIALAGWDRTGWHRASGIGDLWMRMRDRRAILAIPVLAVAYLALVAWSLSLLAHWRSGADLPGATEGLETLLTVNLVLMAWRLAMRATMVARRYGPWEAVRAVPRTFVANLIALLAARRALGRYITLLRGGVVRWDKTAHHFPATVDLPAA
ncbi:glycosyl transferase family protein [Sphingomonas sp. CFBP 13720]|uniref:glycosyl transferase family protein n=1 Tax=Sphingomonas sp. CFBP 13720 TaxID=2775302 RepID=UPI00177E297B|nr:glycosyl transferase family protein [Sphingomonas sp. CFBP 13720]MBD8679932.1 glycosyl transferase family protein [Sphingomonas sp. CFBP 13720]